jgi:hypothetical protein
MPNVVPNGLKQYLLDGTVNLVNDDLYAALFDKNFTPDKDAHDNWGDIKASEMSGGSYPTGGVILADKAATHDDDSDKGKFDAGDVTFLNITLTDIRWVVVYKLGLSDAASKIITFYDLGANQSPNGVDFRIKWNAGGLLTTSQGS